MTLLENHRRALHEPDAGVTRTDAPALAGLGPVLQSVSTGRGRGSVR